MKFSWQAYLDGCSPPNYWGPTFIGLAVVAWFAEGTGVIGGRGSVLAYAGLLPLFAATIAGAAMSWTPAARLIGNIALAVAIVGLLLGVRESYRPADGFWTLFYTSAEIEEGRKIAALNRDVAALARGFDARLPGNIAVLDPAAALDAEAMKCRNDSDFAAINAEASADGVARGEHRPSVQFKCTDGVTTIYRPDY